LIVPDSSSVSCMTLSASTSMRPSAGAIGSQPLWTASTTSGLQPSLADVIRADSSGLAFMNLNAWNIARMLPRTCSGFFLI